MAFPDPRSPVARRNAREPTLHGKKGQGDVERRLIRSRMKAAHLKPSQNRRPTYGYLLELSVPYARSSNPSA